MVQVSVNVSKCAINLACEYLYDKYVISHSCHQGRWLYLS